MDTPLFPLPEPPSELVSLRLDALRFARREHADARRMAHMLTVDAPTDETSSEFQRNRIERQVAGFRVNLWRLAVEEAEQQARALGLDVTSTL